MGVACGGVGVGSGGVSVAGRKDGGWGVGPAGCSALSRVSHLAASLGHSRS